jgi:hypothetical protein
VKRPKAPRPASASAEHEPRESDQAGRLIGSTATKFQPNEQALLRVLRLNAAKATEPLLRSRLHEAIARLEIGGGDR